MMPLSLDAVWPYSPSCCLLFVWTSFLPDISFSQLPFLMVPRSLHPVCVGHLPLNHDSPCCWQLWSPRPDTLFSPDKLLSLHSWLFLSLHFPIIFISLVFSRPLVLSVLYSSQPSLPHSLHFLSASLSLGISFSWDLLLFSSLHISFSWSDFRLAPFFFFPVASLLHTFILGPLSVKLFHLTPSVLTSPLSWSHVSFSHISFFWHFRTLQTKINPVNYKTCTKSFLYHKTCPKYFPVLLRTTKLAQKIPKYYYFILQSLHKRFPSTTSYYKACTKDSPVLLRSSNKACTKDSPVLLLHTTKLAQSTSQYYIVLQSLHKVLPSTTSYYKACTIDSPVLLLHTTKLAQSTSQYYIVLPKLAQSTSQYYFILQSLHKKIPQYYYFILQSLHKVLPSTTSYYKACTKYFPVLHRTTKLAQCTSQYYFVLQSLHKVLPITPSYYKNII